MIRMMNWLYFFGVFIILKILINSYRLYRCKRLFNFYDKYLANPEWSFVQHSHEIIKTFQNANIEESFIPFVKPAGFGMISHGSAPLFRNIDLRNEDVVSLMIRNFNVAIGVYKSRMKDAINPFSWLEFVIFLPKYLLSYLGVKQENLIIKIFQIIYWFVSGIFAVLLTLYGKEIREFLDSFFTQ